MKNVYILIRNHDQFLIKSFASREAAERAQAFLAHGSGNSVEHYAIVEIEHSDEVVAKKRIRKPPTFKSGRTGVPFVPPKDSEGH